MMPKRKLIKKSHRRPQQQTNSTVPPSSSLLERLRSTDPTLIEEALAFISSMCLLQDAPQTVPLLAELLAILHRGPTAVIYQCLYALANLVDLEPQIVPKLCQLGLAKALVQLNSSDMQLLKPILALMTALHGRLPPELEVLEKGVEQSLTVQHLNSAGREATLSYFVQLGSNALKEDVYEKTYEIFKNEHEFQLRALAVSVLMKNPNVRVKIVKELLEFCQEILIDTDLQKQYDTNIVHAKPAQKVKPEEKKDEMEQEEEEIVAPHPNQGIFNDTLEATETLLEALLTLFQENSPEQFEQEEEQGQEPWNGAQQMETETEHSQMFINFLSERVMSLSRNCFLTFPSGQNIVHLTLRVLASLQLSDKQQLSLIVTKCFESSLNVCQSAQIKEQILAVGLYVLMKCPLPQQARELLLSIGQNVLQITTQYKDCWMRLLQIYSQHFNPEKGTVSLTENKRVGVILKKLITDIPELVLEQWRCQAIDTVFDVYSNEDFDKVLVELGLLGLLEQVLGHQGSAKKKKFIRQVLSDIQRFLEYKRKMIKA